MLKKNVTIALVIILSGIILMFLFINKDMYKKNDVINTLKMYQMAQGNYFAEYGKYSKDPKNIGYAHQSDMFLIFFKESEIPLNIKDLINKKDFPFVKDDSYCLIGMYKKIKKTYWRLCSDKNLYEINYLAKPQHEIKRNEH